MKPFRSLRFVQVFVSGWIAVVGCATLSVPSLGVSMSLAVFVVGVLVVPALMFLPGGVIPREDVPAEVIT